MWAWLLKTSRGDFFITVVGEWNQGEALEMVWRVFERIRATHHVNIDILGMIPRKRSSYSTDMECTVYQTEEKGEEDYYFFAGENLWAICGLTANYEAEMILFQNQHNL